MLKDLKVYQLAAQLYKDIKQIPNLTSTEKNQLERAGLSVVLNIAEGCGREHRKDRLRFLAIAMGSLRESQALLEMFDNPQLIDKADHVGALLYLLMKNPGGAPVSRSTRAPVSGELEGRRTGWPVGRGAGGRRAGKPELLCSGCS